MAVFGMSWLTKALAWPICGWIGSAGVGLCGSNRPCSGSASGSDPGRPRKSSAARPGRDQLRIG
ncbi:MAG: hypothetical protein EBQ71_08480 [Betaproteobacteria bacterium]|nr:hypothetical protein [Betaproteobacteria bacterium]